MTSPTPIIALLDELEKQRDVVQIFNAFPILSQKLRESVEALENETCQACSDTNPDGSVYHSEQCIRIHKALQSLNSNLPL